MSKKKKVSEYEQLKESVNLLVSHMMDSNFIYDEHRFKASICFSNSNGEQLLRRFLFIALTSYMEDVCRYNRKFIEGWSYAPGGALGNIAESFSYSVLMIDYKMNSEEAQQAISGVLHSYCRLLESISYPGAMLPWESDSWNIMRQNISALLSNSFQVLEINLASLPVGDLVTTFYPYADERPVTLSPQFYESFGIVQEPLYYEFPCWRSSSR